MKLCPWEIYLPAVCADARQAIRILRSPAATLRLSPSRIGICGFSAGGHLAFNTVFRPEPRRSCISLPRMEATGKVRIQLVDANGTASKQLQEGEAQVHIQSAEGAVVGSWGGSANVSTNGQYEFGDVPPGQYRVSGKPFIPGQGQPSDRASLVIVEARKTAVVKLVHP